LRGSLELKEKNNHITKYKWNKKMFQVQDFKKYDDIYPLVEKLDSLFESSQLKKASKIITQLLAFGSDMKYRVPISYIFSIIAEHDSSLLPKKVIEKCKSWLASNKESLRLNSAAVIGSYLVKNYTDIEEFNNLFSVFIRLLKDDSPDIRDNIFLFLDKLVNKINFKPQVDFLLDALTSENTPKNIISLLKFISSCNELEFEKLQDLRESLIYIVKKSFYDSLIFRNSIKSITAKFYPNLSHIDFTTCTANDLIIALQNLILIIRYKFPAPETPFEEEIDEYFSSTIEKHRQPQEKAKHMISFSLRLEDVLHIYILEKQPLISFFNQTYFIKAPEINSQFSLLDSGEELKAVISHLLKHGFIFGYYSRLGNFYPEQYLRGLILDELNNKGRMNITDFKHIPSFTIREMIKSFGNTFNDNLLEAKESGTYYSCAHVYATINNLAKKNSSIGFQEYKKLLKPSSYYNLVKNLPSEYFSQYHEETSFLTNYGLNQILNEIRHSQSIGFYSISNLSSKFNVPLNLLKKVVKEVVDRRSGIYDISKDTFYYTQFIRNKIKSITKDELHTQETIDTIANELHIPQFHIARTLEAHQHSIEVEIRQQDKISIKRYMGITGLDYDEFMEFIDSLECDYLRHGIWLIFDKEKIEKAKEDIKTTLLDQTRRASQIILTSQNFRITYKLIYNIAQELYNKGKIEGIFYQSEKRTLFYTPKGISNLIKRNQTYFSYSDLFPGKELSTKDIDLLTMSIKKLLEEKKLKGKFNEEELKFSSYDTIYANNTRELIFRFSD
jgi:hypothetical protein